MRRTCVSQADHFEFVNGRIEFLHDRFKFHLWVKGSGPCREPYWNYDEVRNELTLTLCRGSKRLAYRVAYEELMSYRIGWRQLIARALREIRRELRR